MSAADRGSSVAPPAVPLSHGQRALWFVRSLAPDSIAYQGMYVWQLRGEVDPERLRAALGALLDRHEALRTTFTLEGGRPRQRILPRLELEVPVHDATSWSAEELERHILATAERPYDLEAGPFLRLALYARSPSDHHLLLAIHHIVLDHWSIAGLVDELRALYRDPAAALPPLEATYGDFVAWQAEMLAGPVGQRLAAHWREQLAGEPPALELPTDRPRPAVQSFRGAHLTADLDELVVDRLLVYAGRRGATLFMVLLAAFQALLHRCSGQDDIVVGTPMAARGVPRFDRVVGYFTNLLPIRARFDGEPTFDTLVHRVRNAALDALQHQDYPFSLLVEQLGAVRDSSRAALCDVIFAWEGAPPLPVVDSPVSGPELHLELINLRQLGAAVDTAWSVFHRGGGLSLSIQYNADLFDAATIEAMVAHYQVLLAGAARDPAGRVSWLPLMAPAERHRLLVTWNATEAPLRADACIHGLIEEQASREPERPAVAFDGEELSYRELNARANVWARRLRDLGVGPEVRVGLCLDRSLELVVAMLAVLKAGGAFVPLDPTYPPERLAFMLDDARIPVLVTQSHLAQRLPIHGARLVEIDRGGLAAAEERADLPCLTVPANAAYVIYTSGSTGRPKGVVVEHRGLVNVAEEQGREFGLEPGVRVLQFASLSFDACVFEVVMALRWGGTLVLAPREDLMPGPALARFLRRSRVQLVVMPPSALIATTVSDLPDLATITVAGERCPEELPERWAPGRRFFNLYGPTEATIWATCAELGGGRPVTIGRPIGNTQVYVLDRHLEPVPIGVAGELCIGGGGVSRGYLERPGLTAERYVPDPFRPGGGRLYRSGDRVRWRRSGELEFLGRLDHQVKLRGFRIELGEIEALLRADPAVAEAVAVIRKDGGQDERLVAYVAAPGDPPRSEELRDRLRQKLPEYMVPAHVVVLPALPLSPNGKIDRRALPAPESRAAAGTPPAAGGEARIAELWCRVLGVEEVGREDNFFDLGGHSLLLPQVHEELEAIVGRPLPISDLFRFPTVAALAAHLEAPADAAEPSAADVEAAARARSRLEAAGRARRRRGADAR